MFSGMCVCVCVCVPSAIVPLAVVVAVGVSFALLRIGGATEQLAAVGGPPTTQVRTAYSTNTDRHHRFPPPLRHRRWAQATTYDSTCIRPHDAAYPFAVCLALPRWWWTCWELSWLA
jgi:hypothetical protein